MVRVAYCFYGQPRVLEEGYKIFQSFVSRHSDVQFDVFYHTWHAKKGIYEASPWRSFGTQELIIAENAIDRLNDLYKPIQYKVDEPKRFDISQIETSALYTFVMEQIHTNNNRQKVNNLNNILSMFYSIQQVRDILQQHVSKTNTSYDYVILSRFDFLKEVKLNIATLMNHRLYVNDGGYRTKVFCAYYVCDYNIFLNFANIFNNLPVIMNNRELLTHFRALNGIECCINGEELMSLNYISYYGHYENVIFTPLIPNFI